MGETTPDKAAKRDAKQRLESARRAFVAGDFRQARACYKEVIALAPQSELAQTAAAQHARLGPDSVAVWCGLASTALYGLGWVVAL